MTKVLGKKKPEEELERLDVRLVTQATPLTVHGYAGGPHRRGHGVEDHPADPVHADRGRAVLRRGVVGVCGAGNGDPVGHAVCATYDRSQHSGGAPGQAERHGRGVDWTGEKLALRLPISTEHICSYLCLCTQCTGCRRSSSPF